MSDAIRSSYPTYGADAESKPDSKRSLYSFGASYAGTQDDTAMLPQKTVFAPVEEPLVPDRTVAELAIRRLTKELEHARNELKELEETVVQEVLTPSAREWLLPLMAIGLALSLYGSFAANSTAELGATGMMLLWSLSAFWFIYTRDMRREMARRANRAEIEIWSSRIQELEQSLEQNKRIVEAAAEK